jgi:hypothetical protein
VLKLSARETHIPKIELQRRCFAGRDDCPDIAVGTHEHPIPRRQVVSGPQVVALINNIAANTDSVDVQIRTRRNSIAIRLVAQQCPVRPSEQLEQSCRLAGSPADRRVGCAVARKDAMPPFRRLQRERGIGITQVELVDLATATHVPALGGVEQLGGETEHACRNRPPLLLVGVEQFVGGSSEDRRQLPA